MMNSELRENFSQIGGRSAISLRAGIIIFPFLLFSIPILESNFHDWENFLKWTLVSLFSSIPSGLIVYAAHLTYFKDRDINSKPPYSVAILGLLAGAVKGFLVETTAFEVGLTVGRIPIQILVRTLNSAVLGAIVFVLIALSLVTFHAFRIKKRVLIDQLAFQRSRRAQELSLAAVSATRTPSDLRKEINAMLNHARVDFRASREQQILKPFELISILQNTAEDLIRPLSHTLYKKSLETIPKMSLLQTLKALSIHFQIEIPLIATAYFISSFRYVLSMNGLNRTIYLLTWRTILFAAILWLIKILFLRLRKFIKYRFLVAAPIAVTCFSIIDYQLNSSLGYEIDLGKIILALSWNMTMVLVSGFLVAITDVNRYQLDTLKDQIDELAIREHSTSLEQRALYRTYSKILHGVYHSRLIASTVAIRVAANTEDQELLDSELDRAEALLEINFESNLAQVHLTEESLFDSLVANWSGLIDFSIQNMLTHNLTDYQLIALNECLSESVTNAFRHGRASQVDIKMKDHSSGGIRVSVCDNGVGYIKSFPGLGSSIFEELSNGQWEIITREDSHGTEVNIVIQPEENK
jgi:signal transduction histidine kinase